MMDYKDIIIDDLNTLRKKEQQDGNTFKAIAYAKILQQLKTKDKIQSLEDLADIKGLGDRIRKRIEEIIATGGLKEAEDVRKDVRVDMIDTFMNIYGIGRVKAVDLVKKKGIQSIEQLRAEVEKDSSLLNTNQKIGLQYYEDLLERIPRPEMKKHEKMVKKIIQKVSKHLEVEVVGSYRRGEPNSGDIDVLIKWPMTESLDKGAEMLGKIVAELAKLNYIVETLAQGQKKYMGICRLEGEKARRLDLLLTPEDEYAFAVLYFTGSDKFNVEMRRIVLEKGYSMNEHGLTAKEGFPEAPILLTEEAIFNFFGYRYIQPKNRKGAISFNRYLLKNS
jgi:DNA polymerase/3'-5' exonuclease PolX